MFCCPRKFFLVGVVILFGFCVRSSLQHKHYAARRGLCYEFQAIRDLIPRNKLYAIFDRHLQSDANFQRALRFLDSMNFVDVAAQIEESSEYQSILDEFESAGVNVTAISSFENLFNCLLSAKAADVTDPCASANTLGDYENDNDYYGDIDDSYDLDRLRKRSIKSRTSRKLSKKMDMESFENDIFNAIPKDRLQNLIKEDIKKNRDFKEFYQIVTDSDFQRRVISGLSSRGLSKAIRTLRKNKIDVRNIVDLVFKLFSVGKNQYYK